MLQERDRHLIGSVSTNHRILIVDNDVEARNSLSGQLALIGSYRVDEAESGSATLELSGRNPYSMLVVASDLPDMDSRELCWLLRRRNIGARIILIGRNSSDADVILGLESGADDFVTAPYRIGVLCARIRAHLRQYAGSDGAILPIGPYFFHPAPKKLVEAANGRVINLTEKEAAILKYLYRNRDRAVGRASIARDVWGMRADLDTHTVQTHIYRLRRKIEPSQSKHRIILSMPDGGYSLCADWPEREPAQAGAAAPGYDERPLMPMH